VPCADIATMLTDYPRLDLVDSSASGPDGYVTYLCHQGLAYRCNSPAAATTSDSTPRCLYNADAPEVMPDYWTPMEGVVGRTEATFADKFPSCLVVSDYYTDPSDGEALANLEFLSRESLTSTAGTVKPVVELADSASDAFEVGTDTPLHVDRYGNLCTN
jgi:hypothetical protein